MSQIMLWLKTQWVHFYEDPISYAIDSGFQILMMAIGIFILSSFATCARNIAGF